MRVAAPTGVAAFNVDGMTLHSLLHLPTRGDFRSLEGEYLLQLQQRLQGVDYLIIDEMSMVGRKLLGKSMHVFVRLSPTVLMSFLGGAPACLLVTLASCLLSWIFRSTLLWPALHGLCACNVQWCCMIMGQ